MWGTVCRLWPSSPQGRGSGYDRRRLVGGSHVKKKETIWLVVALPLRKMMDFVSWDDYSIPNCFWKVTKAHGSSHHQPDDY